jgi:preprotein translocase subunit YajC
VLVIVWLVLIVAAFYFLLWKPQQRRMRTARAIQSQLEVGDEIMTTSGIYGRIVKLGDDEAQVEIAPSTVIRVARGAIGQRLTPPPPTSIEAPDDDAGTGAA